MDDRKNLSQLASVITLPESNRRARIYRKKVALPFADDAYKWYLHYEQYREGSTHSDFMKGYVLKNFDVISLGIHAEMDFGFGPRAEIKLTDGLTLWGVLPVVHRPTEGAMKGMVGLTVEF